MEFKQLKPTHACSCLWDIDQKPTEIFGHYLKPHEFIHGTNNLGGGRVCMSVCTCVQVQMHVKVRSYVSVYCSQSLFCLILGTGSLSEP